MSEAPCTLRQFANSPVSLDDRPGYSSEPEQPDELAVAQGLSVSEIGDGLAAGGAILDAVVVFTDPLAPGGGRYTPYLRLSWIKDPDGYVPLRLNRGRIKTYGSFETLQEALREWRYTGRITVFNQGDPDITAEFRIGSDSPNT